MNRPQSGAQARPNPTVKRETRWTSFQGEDHSTTAGVWPWLIQMGYKRAGFYSYDRLDNAGIPSADSLMIAFQQLDIGDSIPLTSHDYVVVSHIDPTSEMLWEYSGSSARTVFTWAWKLVPINAQQTRLITRLRYNPQSLEAGIALELFEMVMMRKCLVGIRKRAQTPAR